MRYEDIKKLAELINNKKEYKDVKHRINGVLHNKKNKTVINELAELIAGGLGQYGNQAVLIVVLALLKRNLSAVNDIKDELVNKKLILNLYGGLCILLAGKSSKIHLEIKWSDLTFQNKYEYIRRFAGEFLYFETIEIQYASKIIAMSDINKFENLALKDKNNLLLLNMETHHINVYPSKELIRKLMCDEDELRGNIGFYFALWDIEKDLREYLNWKDSSLNVDKKCKTKKEIMGRLERHLEEFSKLFDLCDNKRKVSLMLNYILYEKAYPYAFAVWLMDGRWQGDLVEEIKKSEKIRTLRELKIVANVIHVHPVKNYEGTKATKDKLYQALVFVVMQFIHNRKRICQWSNIEKSNFQKICIVLPKKYREQIKRFLVRQRSDLMVTKLDEMIRFEIYHKDKRTWEICEGMLQVINDFKKS